MARLTDPVERGIVIFCVTAVVCPFTAGATLLVAQKLGAPFGVAGGMATAAIPITLGLVDLALRLIGSRWSK